MSILFADFPTAFADLTLVEQGSPLFVGHGSLQRPKSADSDKQQHHHKHGPKSVSCGTHPLRFPDDGGSSNTFAQKGGSRTGGEGGGYHSASSSRAPNVATLGKGEASLSSSTSSPHFSSSSYPRTESHSHLSPSSSSSSLQDTTT